MATRAQQIPELTGPFFDGDGTQLSSPYAKFYIGGGAGSANTKAAYSDYLKQTSFTKISLSSESNGIYGDGVYDIEIYEGDPDSGGTLAQTLTYRKYVATLGDTRTITSNTVGTVDDSSILVDTTSGDVTYTLPDAAIATGRTIDIQKISSDGNSMIVAAPSGQTIDNAASVSKTVQNAAISPKSDGSNWFGFAAGGDADSLGGVPASGYERKERTRPESTTITPGSDADVTLSAGEELYGRLILVDGSWTSGHNVIVSTTERGYYIDNSSGSYTATVKTSAGTGIAVGSGQSIFVLCDGTNVIDPLGVIGINQTRQDLTGSRLPSTIYTNTTGRPIEVKIIVTPTFTTNSTILNTGGSSVDEIGIPTTGSKYSVSAVIPSGETYELVIVNVTIIKWSELR